MKTIEVTKSHIDRGEPQNCSLCPIALAIVESGEVDGTIIVQNIDTEVCEVVFDEYGDSHLESTVYLHSDYVEDWILRFDEGESVDPITLELTDGRIDIRGL